MSSTMVSSGRVVGVDAAGKHGWIGVVIDGDGFVGARLGTLRQIIDWAEPVEVIGIDIPIGHAGGHRRPADGEARAFIGPRASSVFNAPPVDALELEAYAAANELLAGRGAPKLSKQGWMLKPKMLETAAIAATDRRVHEVHPEVSFCEMAGQPLAWSKKGWNGLLLRRRLLADAGIVLPDVMAEVGTVVADDVVDAAAAAWSARRIATGTAATFPDPPETSGGRPIAIWR